MAEPAPSSTTKACSGSSTRVGRRVELTEQPRLDDEVGRVLARGSGAQADLVQPIEVAPAT